MKKYTTIITIICLLFAGTTFAQNRWRVNNAMGIDADFSDVQAAIDSASAGDIIYIEGTAIPYGPSNIHLTKQLTLIGPGYFLAANDSTQANKSPAMLSTLTLNPGSSGSYITGLTISNLYINASNVIVSRNNINSISLAYSTSVGNVVIMQNYIGILSNSSYCSAVIKNNIFTSQLTTNDKANLLIYNNVFNAYLSGKVIQVYNSMIKNNIVINTRSQDQYTCIDTDLSRNNTIEFNICNKVSYNQPEPVNNLWGADMTEVIMGEGNNETMYYLCENSLGEGYGENGVDVGAFGNINPYVLSGMPPVPHIYKASIPVTGTTTGGLPVNVKIKSQK